MRKRVNRINVRVGVQNQFAAVFMPLPLGDHFDVNSTLDCAGDEHATQRTLTKRGKAQALAGMGERFAGVVQFEEPLVVSFAPHRVSQSNHALAERSE